jgi:SAM-dependent methyltransferase/uncharacterized coiled-coil protein SlyX
MSDPFYRDFEDRYRGARDVIAQRLRAYLPFIEPLAALHQPARALDIGCGRGEWLELAAAAGFEARGVDIDDGMLEACRARGLTVKTADGIATLRQMAAGSLAMVSAFHVVEHIGFDDVRTLIAEALRVLQPGGLLVLETPNPENIVVGASSFYRDPSHLRPLPPELLSFAVEHAGFARQLVVRLQEPADIHGHPQLGISHVLEGVSPDYAVVAQKAAAPDVMARFDAAFAAPYGISLGEASRRYDAQAAQQRGAVNTAVSLGDQALAQLVDVRASVAALSDRVVEHRRDVEAEAQLARTTAEAAAQLGEQLGERIARLETRMAEADDIQRQFNGVLASRSWRLTAPLRVAMWRLQRLRAALRNRTLGATLKQRGKGAVLAAGKLVLRNPAAKRAARTLLMRFPALQARLRELMVQAPVAPGAPPPATQQAGDLSPRAQRIYADLKQALDKKEP